MSSTINQEHGSVFLETVLASILLCALFGSVFQTAQLLRAHMLLTEAAHEAGRLGSRIGSLPLNPNGDLHSFIRERAEAVILGKSDIKFQDLEITSACKENFLANGVSSPSVTITINASYISVLGSHLAFPLSVTHSASYLGGMSCS